MPFGQYSDFDECVRKNADKKNPKAYCGKIQAAAEADMKNVLRGHEVFDAEPVFEEVDGRMMATIRILRAGTSKNRRTYPSVLVQEAVSKGLFNGLKMFKDHNREKPDPQSRKIDEMVSGIESTSWDAESQSMNGRVEFFDRNFYDYAQRAKNFMGVSINALVRGNRRTVKGEVYEDVTGWVNPRSVDWVTTPAAGGAILAFEDEDEDVAIDWSQVTPELLKANASAVYEAIQAEVKKEPDPEPPDGGEVVTPAELAKAVQEAIDQEREKQEQKDKKRVAARTAVADAFNKSGLPDVVAKRVMRTFEDVEEFDEKAVGDAITEAKEELKAVGAGPRITGQGPTGSGDKPETPSFSVHESVKSAFGIVPKKAKSDDSEEGAK